MTGRKGVKTVPQIYLQGEYVGGYEELMELFDKTEIEESEDCKACEG